MISGAYGLAFDSARPLIASRNGIVAASHTLASAVGARDFGTESRNEVKEVIRKKGRHGKNAIDFHRRICAVRKCI